MRQLDVHDDEAGHELARALHHLTAIGQPLDREAMRAEQIAEKFAIKVVILDNQHSFCH
jgi:hypothetical protein